jgi:transposase InsO family protein
VLACDFFTIETLFLQTVYGLFFYRRGQPSGSLRGWHVSSQCRLGGAASTADGLETRRTRSSHPLSHDHDSSFTQVFDTVFRSESIRVIHTPYHAPNANAHAERWVRTARDECLDNLLIINQAYLRRVIREFVTDYNTAHPHQEIDQQTPITSTASIGSGPGRCR